MREQLGVADRQRRAGFLRVLAAAKPQARVAALECPDDSELSRFLDRSLSRRRTHALEDHFDLCRDCRELAYVLAALDSSPETRDEPEQEG